ncbi:MAG: MgtC/SapB family protein [Anaerolineaceae bacterium]
MIPDVEIVTRLLLAALLGALVGYERERHDQPAGLRTHTILAVGSCLAMTISINVAMQFQPHAPNGDPGRIAAQVVSGIGFLGAGAILRYGTSVRGLTTATSLWTVAIVGLAVGAGHYFAGISTAALLLLILIALEYLEKRYVRIQFIENITVQVEDRPGIMEDFRQVLQSQEKEIKSIHIHKDIRNNSLMVETEVKTLDNMHPEVLAASLTEIPGMISFKIH